MKEYCDRKLKFVAWLNDVSGKNFVVFARICNKVEYFNDMNSIISRNKLKQGFLYHKLRKTFAKFYNRHFKLFSTNITPRKYRLQCFWKWNAWNRVNATFCTNINWRGVQRKNVNNVDMSSLRAPWQYGPYKTNLQNDTKTHTAPRRNRHLEK